MTTLYDEATKKLYFFVAPLMRLADTWRVCLESTPQNKEMSAVQMMEDSLKIV